MCAIKDELENKHSKNQKRLKNRENKAAREEVFDFLKDEDSHHIKEIRLQMEDYLEVYKSSDEEDACVKKQAFPWWQTKQDQQFGEFARSTYKQGDKFVDVDKPLDEAAVATRKKIVSQRKLLRDLRWHGAENHGQRKRFENSDFFNRTQDDDCASEDDPVD